MKSPSGAPPKAPPQKNFFRRGFDLVGKFFNNVSKGIKQKQEQIWPKEPSPQKQGDDPEQGTVLGSALSWLNPTAVIIGSAFAVIIAVVMGIVFGSSWVAIGFLSLFILIPFLKIIGLVIKGKGEAEMTATTSSAPQSGTAPAPQAAPVQEHRRWGFPKLLLVAAVIAGAIIFFVVPSLLRAKPSVVGYGAERCDENEVQNFFSSDADRLTVALKPGCFAGPITLPARWQSFQVTHSSKEGDWVAVWCNGHVAPGRIHPYNEDFSGEFRSSCGGPQDSSATFFAQGRGTIKFRALTYKP